MITITKEQFDIAMRIINITADYGLTDGLDADDKAYELYTQFELNIDKMEERINAIAEYDTPLNDIERHIDSLIND